MTRSAVLAAALTLLAAAPAGSHPGHGPLLIHIADFKYSVTSATIVQNDYVLWSWDGPDTDHSVTSGADDPIQFDSDKGKSGTAIAHPVNDGFSVQFTKPGTYTFHCKVHNFMTGTITVNKLPPSSLPQKQVQAKLSSVSAKVSGRVLVVRYRLNEPASMRARIQRMKGSRPVGPVKELDFAGPPGSQTQRLKLRSLKAGRYRLSLIAVDNSTGKSTPPSKLVFTLR